MRSTLLAGGPCDDHLVVRDMNTAKSYKASSHTTYVSYLRVSTQRQGQSGLGIDAQRTAVEGYLKSIGGTLLDEHVEIESGSKNSRPILVKSIAQAKRLGATLVIAKLDRLARNVAFVWFMIRERCT